MGSVVVSKRASTNIEVNKRVIYLWQVVDIPVTGVQIDSE